MIREPRQLWKPRKYQRTAVKWLVSHPEAALFMDPGLGKTAVVLSAFMALRKAGVAQKMLVVAPLRVCYLVWTQEAGGELAKWRQFEDLTVSLIHGPEKDEALEADADLYVTNFDTLTWLCKNRGLRKLQRRGCKTLVLDELTAFKHTRTQRFKDLKPFLGGFTRRWGLTGSPAANGLLDLFGQVKALDLGKRLGPYVTKYRAQYFVPSKWIKKGSQVVGWSPQKNAEREIYKKLSDLALPMKATDHLDLPEIIEQDHYVTLPKKALKAYVQMEELLIAQLEKGVVVAANGGVATSKCRQIASGGVYLEEEEPLGDGRVLLKRGYHALHDEKTKALAELVAELQGQGVLVGYEFQHDLKRIEARLKEAQVIKGGMTPAKLSDLVRAWNTSQVSVLCGHPQAIGHGLNLQQGGHHVCWYTQTWNYELYDQFIRRVWRQGSKAKRVVVHRIIARGTVDELVTTRLKQKSKVQDDLIEQLKALRARRKNNF